METKDEYSELGRRNDEWAEAVRTGFAEEAVLVLVLHGWVIFTWAREGPYLCHFASTWESI